MISDVIVKDLDAPLYKELIHQMKIYRSDALFQIESELFNGNYENVLAICYRKLATEYYYDRFKYYYFAFLAKCYFSVGDDENLKDICERFRMCVESEKPKFGKKVRNKFLSFTFFDAYLKGDIDACEQYVCKQLQSIESI